MDRRNGGDPLAPPRPPKLLPRVHRPKAPEPSMMSAPPTSVNQQHVQHQLCTNIHSSSRTSSSSDNNNSSRLNSAIANSRNSNNNSNSSNNSIHLTTPLLQLHHHQQQQQHPHTTISLNRNNSNISSVSSTSSVATTVSSVNSFTRRRPPPPPLAIATSSSPILPLLEASLNLNLINNNLNINSIEPVPVSPVTLAAPRPESERLTNEYVDTPFRTAQQLQQASRNQHPAGQHIHGQTTTQHNLLLLQHSQRQHQQQQNQQQQQHHSSHHQSSGSHSNASSGVIGGGGTCIGGALAATIHSNSRSIKGDATGGTGSPAGTPGDGAPQAAQTTPASATLANSPNSITRLQQHHRPNALSITQPITKQPASATFKKDLPASSFHEEALDLHHIGGGASSAGTGSGSLGTPIGGIILGDGALNPITCPRCDRCRCEQCQSPRQLPQTWVCNKTCLCSAETIIDYASCLCCVKALFYHCAKDHEMECDDGDSTLCVDDPCSCLPHKRAQRWGWLGALSLVLPCLWCYWPMRGCIAICEKCYARHAGHGCRCQSIGSTSSMLPIVNIGGGGGGGANVSNGTKSSGVSGGVHSGISGSGNSHHHHHHGANSGGGGNTIESSAARILRKCDITPEKRLLDSSPEY